MGEEVQGWGGKGTSARGHPWKRSEATKRNRPPLDIPYKMNLV